MESEAPTQQQQQQNGRLMAGAPFPYSGAHSHPHTHQQPHLERHLEERARSGCSHASTSTSTDLQPQPLMYQLEQAAPPKKKRGPKAGRKAQLAAEAAAAAAAATAAGRTGWIPADPSSLDPSVTLGHADPYAFHGDETQMRSAANRQRQLQHQHQKQANNRANDHQQAEINSKFQQHKTGEQNLPTNHRQQHMMITQQQQQQQQQSQPDAIGHLPGGQIIRQQQQVMQQQHQPADSGYYQHGYEPQQQQYQDHMQLPAGGGGGHFVPQQQMQPQQRIQRQYHHQVEGSFVSNQQRASPQQQVPPPQQQVSAPYASANTMQPEYPPPPAAQPPRQQQQLIEQRRRMSPNYQQQQPVRHQPQARNMMPSGQVSVEPQATQQYHHQPQPQHLPSKQLKPREQIPAAAQYQQQQQQTYAPFADEQYQSSSATLLQQQLNRSANQQQRMAPFSSGPPAPQPHRGQPAPQPPTGYLQQQQQQAQVVRRAPPETRFEDHPMNDNGYLPADQAQQQVYHFQPQHNQSLQHPQHSQHHQQQQQPHPQMRHQRPQLPQHLEHPLPPAPHLLVGNPTPPLTPTSHCAPQQARLQANAAATGQPPISDQWLPPSHHHSPGLQHVQAVAPACRQQQPLRPMMMPKSAANFQPKGQQQQQYHQPSQPVGPPSVVQHYPQSHQQQPAPISRPQQLPPSQMIVHQDPHHLHHHHHHQQQQQAAVTPPTQMQAPATRLTLPLRDTPLLGPFKLDHDAPVTSKVFHLKAQLFDSLSKSAMMNANHATVIQELQIRAYLLVNAGRQAPGKMHQHHLAGSSSSESLLASSPNSNSNNNNRLAGNSSRQCDWPESFQLTINQQLVHLDRSKQHKAVDIFRYCQPGDNILEIQVNDCYCTHEFVLEAVDRPTLKAFMNSCFKSRLLSYENCLQKLRCNFGQPGFLMAQQQQQQLAGLIINEYISEFLPQQGIEQQQQQQTKVRLSMKCPLGAGQRVRTPTRGHNCKHPQCFDLETFLLVNRDRSQWYCPICYLSIPFNMLELDQLQMNILRALADNPTTDDILMDASGQWQTYFAPPPAQPAQPTQSIMHHQHPLQQQPQQTAKSTGIYHPQAQTNHHQQQQQHILSPNANSGQAQVLPPGQSLARPLSSGPNMTRQQQLPGMRTSSPNSWDKPPKHHQHIEAANGHRRPASANLNQQQVCERGAPADGIPMAKRICTAPPQQPTYLPVPVGKPIDQQQYFNGQDGATQSPSRTTPFVQQQQQQQQQQDNTDDLSPLAAMERTIIQHEMGPPPFDPNSLTSTAPNSQAKGPVAAGTTSTSSTTSTQVASNSPQTALPNSNVPVAAAAATNDGPTISASSPANHAHSLPAASPQQQHTPSRLSIGPESPMQYAPSAQVLSQATNVTSISHPATPSSMLAHGGPETPATPSNSGCGLVIQQQQQSAVHSPHVMSGQTSMTNAIAVVDHQPLSNGSASAGSITSSSTMTPSGQSLGSVGMGSDSRCGTAPLQMNGPLGLDDLIIPGGSSQSSSNLNRDGGSGQFKMHSHLMSGAVCSSSSSSMDEKNEILMGKLILDSAGESLLHRSGAHSDGGELALALEEAEWKQQLDRGKSEHLANFLNEPMMNKQLNGQSAHHQHHNDHQPYQHQHQQQHHQQHHQHHHQHHHHHQQQHQLHHQNQQGASKMLSGGLNPSDDENSPNGSSPQQQHQQQQPHNNQDQMNDFNNYLDCDVVDNGTGLPPDDSILDLFER